MSKQGRLLGLLLVLTGFVLAAALYTRLPDPVPTHFDLHGRPNGYMDKPLGAFILPLVMLGLYLVQLVEGRLRDRSDSFEILGNVALAFLLWLTGAVLLFGAGYPIAVGTATLAACGPLLVVTGNYLGKLRRNRYIGIRTPWTMGDDEIWSRTHRVGGRVFVAGGLAISLCALAGGGAMLAILLVATTLLPAVYSYVLAKELHR